MMRRKNKNKINLPGKIFEKHIQYGLPEIDGVYLCYYKPNPPEAFSATFPVAGMKIMSFNKGSWAGKEFVLAYMGPLPTLNLDQLDQEKECVNQVFVIGTLKMAAQNRWTNGPYPQHILATLQTGEEKHFVFKLDSHISLPVPTNKWSIKKGKWQPVKKENIKKYQKMIKKLKR